MSKYLATTALFLTLSASSTAFACLVVGGQGSAENVPAALYGTCLDGVAYSEENLLDKALQEPAMVALGPEAIANSVIQIHNKAQGR
jgi:hypothetical protein